MSSRNNYLNTNRFRAYDKNYRPKPIITALKAIILHIFGASVLEVIETTHSLTLYPRLKTI